MPDPLLVLDTDHLSLLRRGHAVAAARLRNTPLNWRATTIVNVEEQLRGRFAMIARARNASEWVAAYGAFQRTLDDLMQLRLLPFDDQAAAEFMHLKATVKRVETQDLKIAAIVLTVGGVLVTRNQRDFARISGLAIEDWTQS
ncbi:MAG TPA: type II toxin-antitoxin system VapC family toxin [Blastocatellia bacterium]|nr:type II toxin-antitoxin system VapC family toxin [Blastocatellia bacterium]